MLDVWIHRLKYEKYSHWRQDTKKKKKRIKCLLKHMYPLRLYILYGLSGKWAELSLQTLILSPPPIICSLKDYQDTNYKQVNKKKEERKKKWGGGACNSQEIFKKKGNYFNKTKELKLLSQYLYHQHSNQGEYTLIASRLWTCLKLQLKVP